LDLRWILLYEEVDIVFFVTCALTHNAHSNERTRTFMQATRELMAYFEAPDQDVWQLLLFNAGQNFAFDDDWRTARGSNATSWRDAKQMGLRFAVLDEARFANGGRYFRPDNADASSAVIVHANMRGFPAKVKQLKVGWLCDTVVLCVIVVRLGTLVVVS
jgi:hypothetical protein